MGLPDDSRLVVDDKKLTGYLLSDAHPLGKHKAKFFNSLGYDKGSHEALRLALSEHGKNNNVVSKLTNSHGIKAVVKCNLETPRSYAACIFSIWVSEDNEQSYRLITAYPAD